MKLCCFCGKLGNDKGTMRKLTDKVALSLIPYPIKGAKHKSYWCHNSCYKKIIPEYQSRASQKMTYRRGRREQLNSH